MSKYEFSKVEKEFLATEVTEGTEGDKRIRAQEHKG
jgi:hypothetical protein